MFTIPIPLGPQTTGQIVQVLKGMSYECRNTHQAVTDRTWHPVTVAGGNSGGDLYEMLVFHECGRARILCITFQYKQATFNVYDNLRHAIDSQPLLKRSVEAFIGVQALEQQFHDEFDQRDESYKYN
jgi:hypothetical protein